MWEIAPLLGLSPLTSIATARAAVAFSVAPFPLALAFSAGALTTVNPCGFALLPAYVAYAIQGDTASSPKVVDRHWTAPWRQTVRGGLLGLPLTTGFLLVFSVVGAALVLGGHALVHLFPWLAMLVGAGLVALGAWMLVTRPALEWSFLQRLAASVGSARRRASGVKHPQREAQDSRGQLAAAWTFGVGYGLSSLGCALPIFLLVVGAAITATAPGQTLLILATYATGMALTLFAASLAAAAVQDLLRRAVFPLLRWAHPVAALLLVAAGVYIIQFQAQSGLVFH
ncbi:MAG TPA: cytochrome c biogenesis protein CcdA [Ktedonobacterales bacterium]|nr:cytochrome c biogenesis protein CcdA [Ktedonobacterales bacterium]